MEALPIQYVVSLTLCLLFIPFQPMQQSWDIGFIVPVLWLADYYFCRGTIATLPTVNCR